MRAAIQHPKESDMWKHLCTAATTSFMGVAVTFANIDWTLRIAGSAILLATAVLSFMTALRKYRKG